MRISDWDVAGGGHAGQVAPSAKLSPDTEVAASQLIAFPEHKLMFNGEKMDEGKTLADYGVKESAGCLTLFVSLQASWEAIVAVQCLDFWCGDC